MLLTEKIFEYKIMVKMAKIVKVTSNSLVRLGIKITLIWKYLRDL